MGGVRVCEGVGEGRGEGVRRGEGKEERGEWRGEGKEEGVRGEGITLSATLGPHFYLFPPKLNPGNPCRRLQRN